MLSRIFFSNDNVVDISFRLADLLKLKITKTSLQDELQYHPDYPSLLSINDVLRNHGVDTLAIKTSIEKISSLPVPFIMQIKEVENASTSFTIIKNISDTEMFFYDPASKNWKTISLEVFRSRWIDGVVLLIDAAEAKPEKEYPKKRFDERRRQWSTIVALLAIPLMAVILSASLLFKYGTSTVLPISFTLITLLGCIVGGLLIWYELDQYNPIIKQICGIGKKTNCSAILNSNASTIMGISWSAIGFTYFVGDILLLIFLGINNPVTLSILTWLNALAAPYILFSVYYQWRIAKQWCVLCLGIQLFLLCQLVISLGAGWHNAAALTALSDISVLIMILTAYTIPFIAITLLIPAFKNAKSSKRNRQELQRLKHNPQIFEALLEKQKSIVGTADNLGIKLGNPSAEYTVTKVCNPYCGPCANAHKPMEELLQNNPEVQLQIIFTATNNSNDKRMPPVKHLLAIASERNEDKTIHALDDWYMADEKVYETFAAKYPMNGELEKQDDKIEAMQAWCQQVGIVATPTFFINGKQLPDTYNVQDLKYFLSA